MDLLGRAKSVKFRKRTQSLLTDAEIRKQSKTEWPADQKQIEETTSEFDREKLRKTCKLAGGVAVIRVEQRQKLR